MEAGAAIVGSAAFHTSGANERCGAFAASGLANRRTRPERLHDSMNSCFLARARVRIMRARVGTFCLGSDWTRVIGSLPRGALSVYGFVVTGCSSPWPLPSAGACRLRPVGLAPRPRRRRARRPRKRSSVRLDSAGLLTACPAARTRTLPAPPGGAVHRRRRRHRRLRHRR